MWKFYAILSAVFAAATAILAKVGLKGVNGNIATAIRTIVILFIAWGIVLASGEIYELKSLSKNNLIFLGLSGWQRVYRGFSILRHSKPAVFLKLPLLIN